MSARWEKFCLVGLGGHARTKLLPAIQANGQQLTAVVTRQPPELCPAGVAHFADIESAIAALPADVCFVLASPPAAHFAQGSAALRAGRDVVIEKPAFVTPAEAREAAGLTEEGRGILVEAFMQRHTALYSRFLAEWSCEVDELEIQFVIPAMPTGTFRDQSDMASSSLYDIGCYPLSLLSDLDLPLSNLEITDVIAAGSAREQVRLSANVPFPVTVTIGVSDAYANTVRVRHGVRWTTYAPFFYGRAGDRQIRRDGGVETLTEGNAFETMFSTPRDAWRADQPRRLARMLSVTDRLHALGMDLIHRRVLAR